MKTIIYLALIVFASAANERPQLVCHWSTAESDDIDLTPCDHVIFEGISAEYLISKHFDESSIPFQKEKLDQLAAAKSSNDELEISISIYSKSGSEEFLQSISNSYARSKFIDNVKKWAVSHNFTGIYLSLDFPTSEDEISSYSKLIEEIGQKIHEGVEEDVDHLRLSIKGSCYSNSIDEDSNIVTKLIRSVDNIVLPPSTFKPDEGLVIPFTKCSMLWISMGAKPDSIYAGVPFYGRIFNIDNENHHSEIVNYGQVCSLLKKEGWEQMVSIGQEENFASNGSHWIQYESEVNLRNKALNVFTNGLGGIVAWSLNFDDNEGVCGEDRPLLNSVKTVLRNIPEIEQSSPLNPAGIANKTDLTKTLGEEYCSVKCVKDADRKYDCSRFTQCTFQPNLRMFLKKEFRCPVDTRFDVKRGYCAAEIIREKRDAHNESDATTNSTQTESSSRFGRQYSSTQVPQCTTAGRFRIPTDCHKYQICQPSAVDASVFVSEIEQCLPGLVFSDKTKTCLLPGQVPECSGGTGSTQVAQCTKVGYFRIPSNCSRYLICYPDAYSSHVFIPDLGECPRGLFFSQSARACVLPSNVPECQTTTNNVTDTAPLPVCTASGNFRLGTECGRYISCIPDANSPNAFITQIVNCPTGRVYSSTARTCLPPDQVPTCSRSYPRCIDAGNFPLGDETTIYLVCIPDPNNPGTFIAQIAQCPAGMTFNMVLRACMPANAAAGNNLANRNELTPGAVSTPFGRELACTKPGNFNIGNHCDHFLKCIKSSESTIIAKIEVCSDGMVFDHKKKLCVSSVNRPECQNGIDKTVPAAAIFGRQGSLCTAAGNFRIANSCTNYLQCTANAAAPGTFVSQILTCGNGMSFSSTTRTCLPSSQVPGCGAPPIETSLAIPTCPGVGNFRLGLECDRYLSCVPNPSVSGNFITQIVNCPPGLAFSSTTGNCRNPNLVPECMALSVPNCSAAGNFKLGNDCSRYLSCIPDPNNPGTFIIQIANCPTGLAFDFKTGTCLPAEQVKHCPVIVPTVIPTPVNNTFTPRCTTVGFFRIPTDCTKYLSCFPSPVNGTYFVPQILNCPPGLFFSENQRICQLPSLVPECSNTLPASCSAAGLFSIPSDCSKYLECSPDPKGNPNIFIPEVKYCLSGLYFSPTKKTCLRPADVPECGTGTSSGSTCTAIGLFRIPSDCSKYLRCNPNPDPTEGISFIPEVVYCYPGLVFSDKKKACLRPKEVPECKATQEGYGTKTEVPIQGCSEAGFFPITGDCMHYLACNPNPSYGHAEIFIPSIEECPQGLFFSPKRRFCFRANEVPECRNYLSTGFPSRNNEGHSGGNNQNFYNHEFNGQFNDHFFSREKFETSASTYPQSLAFPNGRVGLCSREGFEAMQNDCSKYIFCTREPSTGSLVALIEHCPIGKLFSRSARKCLPRNDVPECTNNDAAQCEEVGQFALKDDCKNYMICKRNYQGLLSGFVESCPIGHLFSPGQRRCMPAEHVSDCYQTVQFRNQQREPEHSCPVVGVFPIQGDCNNYMKCTKDFKIPHKITASIQSCPNNYLFSASRRQCLHYSQVPECIRGGNNANPSQTPECFNIGKFPYESSCSKYIVCKPDPNNAYSLISSIESCPPRMKFSEVLSDCVLDRNRECQSQNSEDQKQLGFDEYQSSSSSIVECKDQHPIRDQNDCSRFYFCSLRGDDAFEAFAFTCPPGYYFDESPQVRMCVPTSKLPAYLRSCSIRKNEPKAILANSQVCQNQGVIRKPSDCSHFYHCLVEDGRMKQIEFACPQDYMFSEKYSTCSLAGTELPRCSAGAISSNDQSINNGVPFNCLGEGLFPHSSDCRKYFRCRYNQAQNIFNLSIGECPKTANGQQLFFSTKSHQCDWPEAEGNSECKVVS